MSDQEPDGARPARSRDGLDRIGWIGLGLGAFAVLLVGWIALSEWGGVSHGHPAYGLSLAATVIGSLLVIVLITRRQRPSRHRMLGLLGTLAAVGWLALIVWARPHSAMEPALSAMNSDQQVAVTESATQILLTPTSSVSQTGILFQPGALVDPRAYAAVLRPLAAAGHQVVIIKQPFGIAFLAAGEVAPVQAEHPEISNWVLGGHSLGGTVSAMNADDPLNGAAGLLLYASYPAETLSSSDLAVLSISGSNDGLATPAKIEAAVDLLPTSTQFVQIEGASHAQFGDYGPQPGDLEPTISDTAAREQITAATLRFVEQLEAEG